MKDFLKAPEVPYRGPDRRQSPERRLLGDRRAQSRFVPGRDSDRRGGKERRRSSYRGDAPLP